MVKESFTPFPAEVGAARQFALRSAQTLGCRSDDLSLVVSELATNACVHARSPFTVSLERNGPCLLLEVSDQDPTPVEVRPPTNGPSGRGLHIVDALASDWGTFLAEGGKTVWALLACEMQERPLERERISAGHVTAMALPDPSEPPPLDPVPAPLEPDIPDSPPDPIDRFGAPSPPDAADVVHRVGESQAEKNRREDPPA